MNIYEFGDLEKRSTATPLPSEAIVFNGVSLDEQLLITGHSTFLDAKTLSVH